MNSLPLFKSTVKTRPNGDTLIWHAEAIPSLATLDMATRERNVRSIAARAVDGDLADADLDGVSGLLLLAGATWAGACMWREIIALRRAALVTLPAGLMVEVW